MKTPNGKHTPTPEQSRRMSAMEESLKEIESDIKRRRKASQDDLNRVRRELFQQEMPHP